MPNSERLLADNDDNADDDYFKKTLRPNKCVHYNFFSTTEFPNIHQCPRSHRTGGRGKGQ